MNIFKYLDYKLFLKSKIRENAKVYGYKARLAQAAGCRPSYLSQVLGGEFDLSPEHALGLADFWLLAAPEKDYFLQLVHYARAGTPELKHYHQTRLRQSSEQGERELLRGNSEEVTEDAKARFYSSWRYTAVHELTTFAGGRTPEAIARRLELPLELVEETLADLAAMGLAEARGKHWHARVVELMVPPGSHFAAQHIAHWTARAAIDAGRRKHRVEPLHKAWVFGISPADYARLRELLLEHITRCQKIIPDSERHELVCMNLDLFAV